VQRDHKHPIPPLATIQINISNQEVASERIDFCLILAPVSNISVRCSLDQYGSGGAAGINDI
jgi:hypothetical protein